MEEAKIIKINELSWQKLKADFTDIPLYDKSLANDPKTGMEINVSKYPKGFKLDLHSHTCSHGMYVIEGKLKTSIGTVEKGDFAWFPAGTKMFHGATCEEDCVFLFITNAPFDITYYNEDGSTREKPEV